jgi:hypothetical protein
VPESTPSTRKSLRISCRIRYKQRIEVARSAAASLVMYFADRQVHRKEFTCIQKATALNVHNHWFSLAGSETAGNVEEDVLMIKIRE